MGVGLGAAAFPQCWKNLQINHNQAEDRLRAYLYEVGWPVSELARLQVRSCCSGHRFVNIGLHLYACRAGPPCRDPSYRLLGSRLKGADFSPIDRRN